MSTDNQPIEEDLPEQLRIRREKRASLLERNIEPYPVSVPKPYPVGVPVVKTVEKIVEVEVAKPVAVPVLVKPTPALDNKSPNSAVMNAVA